MSEEQGQAATQPLEVMNQMEAVEHLTAALQQHDEKPRDAAGKFVPKEKEEAPVEAAQEEPKEEAAEEPAEEAPAEEAPPRRLKLKYKGEEIEKDETEVISLAQQGFDYTQKSQAIAKEREELTAKVKAEVEQREADYQRRLEVHRKAVEKLVGIDNADLMKIAEEKGPAVAQEEMFKRLQYQQTLQAIESEQHTLTQKRSQEMQAQARKQAEEAVEVLETKIPGWSNDLYGKVLKGAVKEYGFKQQEVNSITDHRAIEVLHDAMKWREFQAAKPQTVDKKVAAVPKVIKPGTVEKADPKAKRVEETKAKLQKSGNRNDAISLVEELMSQGRL